MNDGTWSEQQVEALIRGFVEAIASEQKHEGANDV